MSLMSLRFQMSANQGGHYDRLLPFAKEDRVKRWLAERILIGKFPTQEEVEAETTAHRTGAQARRLQREMAKDATTGLGGAPGS